MTPKRSLVDLLLKRIETPLQARRQTQALSKAIMDKDVPAMKEALEQGADPQRAQGTFEDGIGHFAASHQYTIVGALALAAENGVLRDTFELLIAHGAQPTPQFEAALRHYPQTVQDQVTKALQDHQASARQTPHPRPKKP